MLNKNQIAVFLATSLTLVAIFIFVNHRFEQKTAKSLSLKEIGPYLKQIKEIKKNKKRSPAADEDSVKVVLKDFSRTEIVKLDHAFPIKAVLLEADLDILKGHIKSRFERKNLKDFKTDLVFVNQFVVRETTYVRYQQVVRANFRGVPYTIPVKGAQALAILEEGVLTKINSSIERVDYSQAIFIKEGLFFDLSDREFAKFVGAIKINRLSKRLMRGYLTPLFEKLKMKINFDELLNRQVSEQREILNKTFKKIGRLELQKIFLDLGKANRLSLVRYKHLWLFQVSNFFELPIQFDIQVGEAVDPTLKIKNLREVYHKVAVVKGFESPLYPGGKKVADTESSLRAKAQLEKVVAYINKSFGWGSYQGKDSEDPVSVHTQLRSIDFRENAAWIGSVKQILVGEDGETLHSLDNSLSVLGHEYSHAIVQFASGLLYQGQSGAINEHFADIVGASVEADGNEGKFLYTIGEDVLREGTRAQKKTLLNLVLAKAGYNEEQKKAFRLGEIGMRHLYAPELSYTTQYEHMEEVNDIYPKDCEPSYDNDNCGVHMSSGVLNRALSLAISIEGVEKIMPLVFNTVAFRLSESGNFKNYLVELYEECKDQFGANDGAGERCNIILASFARVGVFHPDFPIQSLSFESAEVKENKPKTNIIPVTGNATTPILKLCGWVEQIDTQNYRISDGGKYNALLVNRNFSVKTKGDYFNLNDMQCACVTGRITQKNNLNNETKNIFLTVDQVEDRGDACLKDPDIADSKPEGRLRFDDVAGNLSEIARNYCGWVSVNSSSKNVTIIDNKFDAAILVNEDPAKGKDYRGSLTGGVFPEIYDYECACVRSELVESVNSKGTIFNSFSLVEGITKRGYEDCIGLEWK